MRNKYDADAEVLCPFYQSDNRISSLICEGIADGGRTSHWFPNKAEMVQQKRLFCCDCFQNCEWFGTLMHAKYSD